MKVKVFYAVNGKINGSDTSLEDAVNDWLKESKPVLVGEPLLTSSGRLDHHVTLTYHYK